MHNLLDPAILFFLFGVFAGAVKSNLAGKHAVVSQSWRPTSRWWSGER